MSTRKTKKFKVINKTLSTNFWDFVKSIEKIQQQTSAFLTSLETSPLGLLTKQKKRASQSSKEIDTNPHGKLIHLPKQ